MMKAFSLEGKTALVTGASRGLGRAMALALADAGADIVAASAHLPREGSELAREVRERGRRFWAYAVDFRSRQAVRDFAEQVDREVDQPIDILVNNAGMITRAPAREYPDEDWDAVLAVNLTAPFVLSRHFGRQMVERGAGKIIFTASLLSFQGGILVPAYSASKGGVVQLAKTLSNEWARYGVQVNCIAPGYMATDNTAALRADPARQAEILARIPAGRWGMPEDLHGVVVFLASSASDYVTGAVIPVDGGWLGR
ncbi:MAG: SDR family NAD(P)-dependent oxidoreductase [Firmicutes bacterium]|nr:SDR family NAD(P)-dependent oxidoreductase [Bacillota bacterium]